MEKKKLTFQFVETEEKAIAECSRINAGYSRYMRKNKPETYTTWSGSDGKEQGFVVWYHF